MLSTKILKTRHKRSKAYNWTEKFFVIKLNGAYQRSLNTILSRKYIALSVLFVCVFLIFILWKNIPAEMAPLEDRSQLSINITTTEGSTYEFNEEYTEDVAALIKRTVPEIDKLTTYVRGSRAFVRIVLVPPSERKRTQNEIANQLTGELRKMTKARASVIQQSTFGGRRAGLPIQYVLQAPTIDKLREILPEFMAEVQDNPIFEMADVNLKFTKPELQIVINRDKANLLGVSTQNIGQTLQLALSGQRFGYFIMNGKQYEILENWHARIEINHWT